MDDYSVQCICGASMPATAGMAGTSIRCGCGREVTVPPLSQLRLAVGRDAFVTNAVEAVRKALADGSLPGTTCIRCHGSAGDLVHCRAICERSFAKRSIRPDDDSLLRAFCWCFVPVLWLFQWSDRAKPDARGRNTVVELTFRLCRSCRADAGDLRRAKVVKRLLEMEPRYAQLLEEFPETEVECIGATG